MGRRPEGPLAAPQPSCSLRFLLVVPLSLDIPRLLRRILQCVEGVRVSSRRGCRRRRWEVPVGVSVARRT